MHKFITRTIVAATIAGSGLGVAASVATAVAPAAQAAVVTSAPVIQPLFGTWHKMTVTLNGTTYNGYWVLLHLHRDGKVTGWLFDGNNDVTGVPGYLAVNGSYDGTAVQFNAEYPAGNPQGDRGFIAINSAGHLLTGLWNETGTEGGSGAFAFTS
jgi:hypothetical protein